MPTGCRRSLVLPSHSAHSYCRCRPYAPSGSSPMPNVSVKCKAPRTQACAAVRACRHTAPVASRQASSAVAVQPSSAVSAASVAWNAASHAHAAPRPAARPGTSSGSRAASSRGSACAAAGLTDYQGQSGMYGDRKGIMELWPPLERTAAKRTLLGAAAQLLQQRLRVRCS